MSLILIGIKILTVKNPVCNGFFLSLVNRLGFFLSDILYEKLSLLLEFLSVQGKHCLLNISPSAIERLHRLQIYPIVVFARHRSHKQLR